ncbi:MAG: EamA family transporter [Halobacteriota archaeon]
MALEWFYFALLSSALIAAVNIVDKVLISDYNIPPLVYAMVISATSLMPLVIVPFIDFKVLSLAALTFTMLVGFVRIYYTLPYFKALTIEEVSRVVPVLQLMPVFVLVLSTIFLREVLGWQDYTGFALLVIGGTLCAIRLKKGITVSMAFYLMIASSFLLAVYSVGLKVLFSSEDFYSVFIWVQIAGFITLFQFMLFKPLRSTLVTTYKATRKRVGALIVGEQAVAYVSVFAYNYAIAHGAISLVSAVASTQPLFVLLFATAISYSFPRILKEQLTKQDIILKCFGIAIIFLGAFLINVYQV